MRGVGSETSGARFTLERCRSDNGGNQAHRCPLGLGPSGRGELLRMQSLQRVSNERIREVHDGKLCETLQAKHHGVGGGKTLYIATETEGCEMRRAGGEIVTHTR